MLSHPAPWAKVRPEIMVANNSHHLAVSGPIPLAGNKRCCCDFIIFWLYFWYFTENKLLNIKTIAIDLIVGF